MVPSEGGEREESSAALSVLTVWLPFAVRCFLSACRRVGVTSLASVGKVFLSVLEGWSAFPRVASWCRGALIHRWNLDRVHGFEPSFDTCGVGGDCFRLDLVDSTDILSFNLKLV